MRGVMMHISPSLTGINTSPPLHPLSFHRLFSSSISVRRVNSKLPLPTNHTFFDLSLRAVEGSGLGSVTEGKRDEMTITPSVKISDRKLIVKDRLILSGVPENVISTSAAGSGSIDGVFLGAQFQESKSRHLVSLGTLRDVRFMACFRFKLWWMAQRMGDRGRDVPMETQFLIAETKQGSHLELNESVEADQILYIVFLPLVEGPFRASLQGNAEDELEICFESGDEETKASTFTHSLFVSAGTDPFAAVTDAVRAVKLHLKSFRQRHEKKVPGIVDYFGWCTWDAFYQDVTQEGVEAGLKCLSSGVTPPRFVIIDDGWQSVEGDLNMEEDKKEEQPLPRLTGIKENSKFKNREDPTEGIKGIVKVAKEKYGLKYVYVWHAITGYWGGVRPGVEGMEEYGSKMQFPSVSPGVALNEPSWKTDVLALQGLGLVNPKSVYKFYNELHGYLASSGIDGVKVDVQCILETVGTGLGGRVELTRQYHQALDASVARNFPDNGIIACMSHNTDALYCSKQTAIVRASDDFYPRDPMSHTIHIASVSYNSVFLGEFMIPDWDMFHSLHPTAEYHASARAISGGPIYVSDEPGKHNFELLRKLVLPDGSILRARLPGRPTRDCLFTDPTRDGVSLLKIWNMNKHNGVVGVYNCQGAAWSSVEKKNMFHQTGAEALTGAVNARDVHLIAEAAAECSNWNGDCALFSHQNSKLTILPFNAALPISLKVLDFDIYVVSPIRDLLPGFRFAPLGLIDMFNGGGAIEGLRYEVNSGAALELSDGYLGEVEGIAAHPGENMSFEAVAVVAMEVKGCGRFGAYSSSRPRKCSIGSTECDFSYDSSSGHLVLSLDYLPEEGKFHIIEIEL